MSSLSGKAYSSWMREDITQMVELVDLSQLQKHYVRSRWLEQVIWMEDKAQDCRNRYYALRLTAIIGGLIVPALVGLNAFTGIVGDVVYWMIFVLSLMVSISTGLEEFIKYGDRWRHYRAIVEELKIVGWHYFQLAGNFKDYNNHKTAYVTFVNTVEELIQKEVQVFVSNVTKEEKRDEQAQKPSEQPADVGDEPAITPLYPKTGTG